MNIKKNLSLWGILSLIFITNSFALGAVSVQSRVIRPGKNCGHNRSTGRYDCPESYRSGRHFGKYSHRGYVRYGNQNCSKNKFTPAEYACDRKSLASPNQNLCNSTSNGRSCSAMRAEQAVDNKPRGDKYWGYYSPYYDYGLYPWYNYGDPFYYYQKADYYPWYYGFNPAWLWW